MKYPVFVYGSLRQGASNAWRMNDSLFVSRATVGGTWVKVDWYPGLVLDGESQVLGDVYQVNDKVLAELDAFEGIEAADGTQAEYRRVKSQVLLDNGEFLDCLVYEWLLGLEGYQKIETGDWLTVKLDLDS